MHFFPWRKLNLTKILFQRNFGFILQILLKCILLLLLEFLSLSFNMELNLLFDPHLICYKLNI